MEKLILREIRFCMDIQKKAFCNSRGGIDLQYIHIKEIPKSEGNVLGSILYDSIKTYFDDPEHVKEFELWKQEQKRKSQI